MTDLTSWIAEAMAKPLIEGLSAIGMGALVTRLKSLQSKGDATAGGPPEERRVAYAEFRRAVVEFRTSVSVLSMAPLRFAGALWTLPIHLRAINRTPAITVRMLDSFLEINAVGQKPTIDAAGEVLVALSSAVDTYAATSARRGAAGRLEVGEAIGKLDVALAEFTLAVRRDLGYAATTEASEDQ